VAAAVAVDTAGAVVEVAAEVAEDTVEVAVVPPMQLEAVRSAGTAEAPSGTVAEVSAMVGEASR
jgi:hypothetical protein